MARSGTTWTGEGDTNKNKPDGWVRKAGQTLEGQDVQRNGTGLGGFTHRGAMELGLGCRSISWLCRDQVGTGQGDQSPSPHTWMQASGCEEEVWGRGQGREVKEGSRTPGW